MNFKFKKIGTLLMTTAIATSLSCGMNVFATTSCMTTTTYTGTSTVSVVSNIFGATALDQITFLVAPASPTQSNIVYIDQAKADASGNATFRFSTSADNLGLSAKVKFGAQATANIATVSGNNADLALSGTKMMSSPVSGYAYGTYNSNQSELSLTAFGTLTNAYNADINGDTCGILISTLQSDLTKIFTASEIADLTVTSSPKKFAAFSRSGSINGGRNVNGQFAIQLVNGSSTFLKASTPEVTSTYYIRTYGIFNGGTLVTLGDVKSVIMPTPTQ